jgi:phosphate starvation-inducible PhoH-like protein
VSNKKAREQTKGVFFNEFKPKTRNQNDYIRAVVENDVTIVNGPSGTGKTFLAIGLACQHLLEGKIKNILYTRSIISAENDLGSLPGSVEERCAPYFISGMDYFNYFYTRDTVERMLNYGEIKVYPIELLRGHTYHNSVMIADEAQNMTPKQLKLFLSRLGNNSKAIIIGDIRQSDTPYNGLRFLVDKFQDMNGISFVELTKADILRNGLIGEILTRFEDNGV